MMTHCVVRLVLFHMIANRTHVPVVAATANTRLSITSIIIKVILHTILKQIINYMLRQDSTLTVVLI